MKILFACSKHCQDFSKTEEELSNEKVINRCPYCGEKLKIANLEAIVSEDLRKKVKENIKKYFSVMGIEATIEMCERNKNIPGINLYFDEFKKMGLLK